jgi:hypothetical protein
MKWHFKIRHIIQCLLFTFFICDSVLASSMHRCLLLPIKDEVGGSLSFPLFEKVEEYLKSSDWCYYKANSDVMNILMNYKKNLHQHLANKEVLRAVAEKTRSGSLIKISLSNHLSGIMLNLSVIDFSGEDIVYDNKVFLRDIDIDKIADASKNFLEEFKIQIPYDAQVIGVVGDTLSVDMGSQTGIRENQNLLINRPTSKRKHPLLKSVVDWNFKRIGKAKVTNVEVTQSLAKIINLEQKEKVMPGDWLVFEKDGQSDEKFEDPEKATNEFGKLGSVSLFGILAQASAANSATTAKKISGLHAGATLDGEFWVTRNYIASLSFTKLVGSMKKSEGDLTVNSYTSSINDFSLMAGYRYLPMNFFFGPQLDLMIGYRKNSYGLDTSVADGFSDFSFKGLAFEIAGSIPFKNAFRAYLNLNFLLSPGYSEETTVYGEDDSASLYNITFGGLYSFESNLNIDARLNFLNATAKFIDPVRKLELRSQQLMIGVNYLF